MNDVSPAAVATAADRTESGAAPSHGIAFGEAVRVWARVAALSFGGPAGQIAVMHRILVEEKRWIGEKRFLHALNYCMLLPGPEAQQLAIYIGWLLHRTKGGLVAGTLFVLPGFVAIMALSLDLRRLRQGRRSSQALFFGLKAAVLAVVLEAVLRDRQAGAQEPRHGRRSPRRPSSRSSSSTCRSRSSSSAPALIGYLGGRAGHPAFLAGGGHGPGGGKAAGRRRDGARRGDARRMPGPTSRWSLAHRGGLPRAVARRRSPCSVVDARARQRLQPRSRSSSRKMAVVTFGGAYAVLAYVAQQAVETYGWLQPGEMLDGLGMAETTPGPLIMVTQFVGFMGAFREPGGLPPLLAGALGGLLTTWVTFVPCFLWIFLGAPFVEALRGNKALSGALAAITAAVVGVILNLAVWFAPARAVRRGARAALCWAADPRRAGPGIVNVAVAGADRRRDHRRVPLQGRHDPGARRLLRRRAPVLSGDRVGRLTGPHRPRRRVVIEEVSEDRHGGGPAMHARHPSCVGQDRSDVRERTCGTKGPFFGFRLRRMMR